MRLAFLALALLAAPAAAQEHKPLRPATAEQQKARAAVVIADYRFETSRNYVRPRIVQSGSDVADFTVDYEPWPVDTLLTVRETRRSTLPAGTNFARMNSTIASSSNAELIVGIGISKRPTGGNKLGGIRKDAAAARPSRWGPADGDKVRMAAVDPEAFAGFAEDADNYLILIRVLPGRPFVYFSGVACDRGGDFAARGDWNSYVDAQRPDFRP